MIHSCNPSPPLPRGLSRLCSGPAPNPSREIEKLSTLSLLNVASYLAMLFAAQHPCSTHPCGITPLHIACTASVVVLIQCVWNYTASAAELRNNVLWTATIWGNFFPEMTSLIRPSPELADVSASAPHYGARVVIASEYLEEQETLHGWLLAYYIGLGVAAAVLTINTIFWLLRGQAPWLTSLSI